MTNQDFYNEIVEHCKKENDEFLESQRIISDLFSATHKILTENGIDYYLFFGTLLGAYRDKGFIPWDNDFDIAIYYDDAMKVQKLLEEQLPENMYIVSNFNDRKFPYYMMKVCLKGLKHLIHVDIYYIFGLPEKGYEKIAKKLPKLYWSKYYKGRIFTKQNLKGNVKYYYLLEFYFSKLKYLFKTMKGLDRKYHKLLTQCPVKDVNFCSTATVDMFHIPKEYFGTPVEIDLCGMPALVPHNTEECIKIRYKDYREYLPFEQRYAEYQLGLNLYRRSKE